MHKTYNGRFRSFTPQFREHLSQYDAWPDQSAINSFRGKDMSRDAYASLQNGNIESYRYIIAILSFMLQDSDKGEIPRYRKVLFDYLHDLDVFSPESLNAYQVAHFVCGPGHSARKRTNIRDAFEHWLELLIDGFVQKRTPVDYVRFCNAQDVREAIEWMYIELGRAVGGKRLSRDASRSRAESAVQIRFEDYVGRAVEWHDRCPWSVIRVLGDRGKEVGMCINLPVHASTYESVRRGERTSSSCCADELVFPSQQLIAEGLALCPREDCDRSFSDTRAMFYAVLCQQAKLSDVPGLGWEFPMRLLSFAATSANRRRLRWVGYRPVGADMPGTGWNLFERTLDLRRDDRQSLLDLPLIGVWVKLQIRLKSLSGH